MKTILMALMLTILMTGCSVKDANTGTNADTNSNVNSDTGTGSDNVTSTEAADNESSDTLVVTDERGEVEIPANPERIVDLSGNSDILSILGYQVVGTANSDAYDYTKFPSYLEDALEGAAIVGFSMQDTMDVEGIMNLSPDLIIISTVQEKMYEQLQEIAPTVMIQLEALNWKEDIKAFAKIFGKEEAAETWIADYEKKAKESGEKIKAAFGEDTTYLAFLASAGQFFIFDGAGFGSVLYEDMGLVKPEGMPEQSDISLPVVTYEGLAAIHADYIFVLATDDDLAVLKDNAIWNSIPAVKEGNIITLPASPYFVQGYSSIGRNLLIQEIVELLNGQK
jgi:iron complex transport system substrate-binding protein